MNLSTALMFAQAGSSIIGAPSKIRGAKKVAKAQRHTLEKYYQYNKGEIERAYDNGFKNMMNNHILNRNALTEQTKDIQSQLNIKASQDGINVSNSSYTDDIQNQLDFEFEVGMQDMITSQSNQIANLVAGMTTQQLQLEQQYSSQLNSINAVEDSVIQKAQADIFGSLMNVGIKGFDDFSNYSATNENGSFGNWLTTFNMPKKLGGK
ncbi:MAG: hypothetical protein ACRCX2_14875 [Paraclostridium sp.]